MEEDLTASFQGQGPYGDCPSPSINTPELDCFLGSDSIPSQFTNEPVLIDPSKDSWLLDCLNVGPDVSNPDQGEGTSSPHREGDRGGPQDGGFGCPRSLCTWPPTPVPYHCTCCQVLREIVHTNGIHTMKFEIHGRIGLISHGILENYYYGSENRDRQMFDFCHESLVSVKNFLKNYFEERRLASYTLLPDTLSMFYKTLCVGLNNKPTAPLNDLVSSHTSSGYTLMNSGKQDQTYQAETSNLAERQNGNSQQEAAHHLKTAHQTILPAANPSLLRGQSQGRYSVASPAVTGNQGESSTPIGDVVNSTEAGNRGGASDGTSKALVIRNQPESSCTRTNPVMAAVGNAPRRRRSYAEQRARAKNLTWGDMSSCFHLRLRDAAKTLELCETTVKKRLHELIKRWPYRTVNKLRKEISLWKKRLNSVDEHDKEIARTEIQRLQQELEDIYSGKVAV